MDNIADNAKNLPVVFHRSEISGWMGIGLVAGGIYFARMPYHCRPRVRKDYLVLLTLHGEAWVREGDRRRQLRAGDWFLLRPEIEHEYDSISPWSFAYAHMAGGTIASLLEQLEFFSNDNLGFRQRSNRAKALLIELIKRGVAISSGSEAVCNALLVQLLVTLHEDRLDEKPLSARLALARKYIEEHFGDQIELMELANVAGMSQFHFCRMFRAAFGLTPGRFMQKYRIEQAGRMLQIPGAVIGDVAESVGFADQLYFSKVFHKWTGTTPTAYRAFVRGKHE